MGKSAEPKYHTKDPRHRHLFPGSGSEPKVTNRAIRRRFWAVVRVHVSLTNSCDKSVSCCTSPTHHILCDIYPRALCNHPSASLQPPTASDILAITSIMRIFDVYEHPSFEVEKADETAAVRTTIRRFGVGATVSAAIAAISFWGYYWSDPTPPSAVFTD
jgi:hypothetical protein